MVAPSYAKAGQSCPDGEVSTAVSESEFSSDALSRETSEDNGSYNSCFYVPPPPRNVVRVYHNRKKTSYTDYPLEIVTPSAATPTLFQLLASEANPSRAQVSKAAFDEGMADEDSNLMDVLENVDVRGWTPLIIATRQQQAEAVHELLSLGAMPDCQDPETGCTPLILAVTMGNQVIVQHLLDFGANTTLFTGPDNRNPLCEAIFSRRADVIDMVLAAGGDLETVRERYPALAESYLNCRECLAKKALICGWMSDYWPALLGFKWRVVMPASV
mmetsp:Transcript_105535/g.296987  ORF Transcript_105535/g.296987 Transcript_105535/m.296987 type:complete len:273 (+) Transcript_105535:73-891(+)